MLIRFDIEYRTIYGEDLFLNQLKPDGSALAHPMRTRDGIIWSCQMEVEQPIEYYYTVTWEGREKRSEWVLCPHSFDPKEVATPDLPVVQRDAWMDAPEDFRVAGTLIPVFSLRSRRSFGVGDFGDLRMMIDWVASTGQRLLQILPINDTTSSHTWGDSYPYSCISVFALHPQYIELAGLPSLKDKELREHYEQLRQELNALPQIDYERVNKAKWEYLQHLYEQEGPKVLASRAFADFAGASSEWLEPYVLYCHLRDTFGTGDFSQWPEEHREYRTSMASSEQRSEKLNFYRFVQFLLAQQLSTVHAYARSRGVILKGDIPIGVARYGCDVWQEPRYFNLNGQAGAPPDDFAADGQNWGFPTYNWDEMLRDGCSWWKRRFRNMARYFDAYRIDHVLGFFRIWEIPVPRKSGLFGQFSPALAFSSEEILGAGISRETLEKTIGSETGATDFLFLRDHRNPELLHPRIAAQKTEAYKQLPDYEKQAFNALYEDFFYHRNNQFWYEQAMQKLPKLVHATRMLCCAEDLGMVPACVQWVMDELGILSLELESMPKEPWVRFGHVERNPRRSVATISSHDTPTLRMWWDEDWERTQDYYTNILHLEGSAPHPLPGKLVQTIIQRHLDCPSMLCVISLQDWLAMDEHLRNKDADAERINVPADPHHYWRYRMHLNIEDLKHDKQFTERIRTMIVQGNRV